MTCSHSYVCTYIKICYVPCMCKFSLSANESHFSIGMGVCCCFCGGWVTLLRKTQYSLSGFLGSSSASVSHEASCALQSSRWWIRCLGPCHPCVCAKWSSWLPLGSVQAAVGVGRLNQWMEDLFYSVFKICKKQKTNDVKQARIRTEKAT